MSGSATTVTLDKLEQLPTSTQFDVLILGAGAAGLMCAFEAGRRGRTVAVLDHAERAGKKILISGGGRCNFTNLNTRPENFLSENPHFAKSALSRFTPEDMIALVEKHNIRYHEKTLGQLFCDRSAQEIVALLERECTAANVRILTGTTIESVAKSEAQHFTVATSRGTFTSDSLVVATGGLSIPKMGATGLGYEIARQFGLKIIPCRPGLVPFTLSPGDLQDWADLSGLSAPVVASAVATGSAKRPRVTFREKMLITHRGLSGPAILQISSFWNPGDPILLDLAPNQQVFSHLLAPAARRDATTATNALRAILPARMAERWVAVNTPERWTNSGLEGLEASLHAWQLHPAGTEGYAKAEVTAGGVDTRELDAKTLQSRKVPGLYFIGEVVDVTGWLGGYNFQWAWASAVSAAQSA
ncbi:BaiN/RdsA family NAD(P)/FAD-dependent oxidoreductase [Granulicella aggregans]|jgi:predicted Rossmann fold flavoprotein|uniref:NAD(P)/FAD-dependent oxidoreductase n=1 Tax=Granulicella aggregans TaxID=474949 RepID=UPI0021DFB39F|nr:NAD(P)/FAD-dependent oxidoreductase [Granulicella aggregans]